MKLAIAPLVLLAACVPDATDRRPAPAPGLIEQTAFAVRLAAVADQPTVVAARGMTVGFRLLGARPVPGVGTGDELVFRGGAPGGGTITFRAGADRVEDYVTFAEPTPEGVRYALNLDSGVAGIRLIDDSLELLDTDGVPRLRMDTPYVLDRNGNRHRATTELQGCAVDRSSAPPWSRTPVPPGAASCVVAIRWPTALEHPITLDPTWTTTASWSATRVLHTATVLSDGRVLVAGGTNSIFDFRTCEIFDPATSTWAKTGSIAESRHAHGAALLADGRVLIAGQQASAPSAEIWSPSTGLWTATAAPSVSRLGPTVTALSDGRVLLFGGHEVNVVSGYVLSTAQIWSPTTGTWSAAPSAADPRENHTATLMPDGRVLVVGGRKDFGYDVASATFFDPTGAGSWTTPIALPVPRSFHRATLLRDGRVLLTGGLKVSKPGAEIFDPVSKSFTPTAPMIEVPHDHTATLLPDGDVLVTGGYTTSARPTAQVFSPTANLAWSKLPDMSRSRSQHTATLLPSVGDAMRVLVAGDSITVELLTGTQRTKTCASDADCMTGHCEDGLCCDSACGGCLACTVAKRGGGADGECGVIPTGKDPDGDCPTESPVSCGKTGVCNGAGACALYAKGTSCGDLACEQQPSGVWTETRPECTGDGKCEGIVKYCPTSQRCWPGSGCSSGVDAGSEPPADAGPSAPAPTCLDRETVVAEDGVTTTDCRPYVCGTGRCFATCGSDAQCATGYVCRQYQCVVPPPASGAPAVGGCAFSSPGGHTNGWSVVLMLTALCARSLRRRARATAARA